VTPEDRTRVGRAWLEMGLNEHASVAAFARFVLHLMSLGAPPALLLDTIRAMEDEVEHARLCFGMARRLTGEAAGPGPMDLSNVFDQRDDPQSTLIAAILEGCFAETISARSAEVALDRAEDPTVRAVLTRIAADESRHADLSWRFVGWMIETHADLLPAARACFAEGLAAPVPAGEQGDECAELERYGHLLPSSQRQVAETVLRETIGPRARALLGLAEAP
jgi:hypothetical protein